MVGYQLEIVNQGFLQLCEKLITEVTTQHPYGKLFVNKA